MAVQCIVMIHNDWLLDTSRITQKRYLELLHTTHDLACHDICRNIIELSQWRHNTQYDISYQQPHDCSLNRLFRRISKKTSKLRVTGLCGGNSPAQMASNAENISIWWRHHEMSPRVPIESPLLQTSLDNTVSLSPRGLWSPIITIICSWYMLSVTMM